MSQAPNQTVDLRGTPCPLNWVKTKLRLEEMAAGQLLAVMLDEGEPIRNVPASVRAEGHKIVAVQPVDGGFQLLIEKDGAG
jgi:tRNA 2-thiouridine synthesizing protein A